jgi:di/tricarboxylate transporter
MKKQQKKTLIFILVVFIIIVITDAIWAVNGIKADTISEFTRDSFKYTGGIFFALGFLLAHLGWYRDANIPVAVSMIVMIVGGVFFGFIQSRLLVMPIWWVIPGVPLGHFLWPQKKPDNMRFGE